MQPWNLLLMCGLRTPVVTGSKHIGSTLTNSFLALSWRGTAVWPSLKVDGLASIFDLRFAIQMTRQDAGGGAEGLPDRVNRFAFRV